MPAIRMWAALFAVTAFAAASCSSDDDSSQSGSDLMGKTYLSTRVEGTPIPGGGPLTLTFRDDRLTANAGCNTMTGPVTLDGNTLKVGDLAATMMACPGDRAGADGWLDGLLRSAPDWKPNGADLTLKGNGVTVTLQDRKVAKPDKPLVGTTWIVTSLISKDAVTRSATLDAVRPAITISPDGAVSGSAGCNRLTGKAEVSGTDVTFQVGTTRMMCEPDVMEVERQVLAVLDGKTTATVDSDELTLRNAATGTGLGLRAE
ncbi:META domain-containing protein [Nocardia yamanashiensis]|uniref:META domain-containing protein n=1 Tax=Nocardia yamanashiensis TaxID=209247 RepID=UPI001E47209C|nr:META domain-containing protein [Nocardia yamanashiensis]UGT43198.1 META domain-containing protein [Nocardia yamanashiensis]